MGILLRQEDGKRVALRTSHVVGRNPSASHTLLSDPDASLLHSILRWRDGAWWVTSHGRNGTWLDDKRLPGMSPTRLAAGQVLRFGSHAAAGWTLLDASAPTSMLMPLDPALAPIPLGRHTLVPDNIEPLFTLCECLPGHWEMERDGEQRPLMPGDVVEVAGAHYRLVVVETLDDTQPGRDGFASPRLTFHVSLDEEHTSLYVAGGERSANLGERTHHYALVTLARKRIADARAGLDATAQGWIESAELARMLGIEPSHLNIQLFRARDQFVEALKEFGMTNRVIERRRGGLRLGTFSLEVYRGSTLEGRLVPADEAQLS